MQQLLSNQHHARNNNLAGRLSTEGDLGEMDLNISQARQAKRRVRMAREEFSFEFDLSELRILRVRKVFTNARPVPLREGLKSETMSNFFN